MIKLSTNINSYKKVQSKYLILRSRVDYGLMAYDLPIHLPPKGSVQKKKIAEKETLVHSRLPPPLPSLNGTRGMGT